jgi:ribosome maturation factor RimP
MAEIRTIRRIDGRKKFRGILGNTSKEGIDLLINDKTVSIPFGEITKARLVKYDGEN